MSRKTGGCMCGSRPARPFPPRLSVLSGPCLPELLHDVEDLLGRYLGDRILTSLSRVTASGPL